MASKREVFSIIIGIVIFTLLLMFVNNRLETNNLFRALIISASIILISIFSKKIAAYKLDMLCETKILEFKRYWISTNSEFKKAIPLGILWPILWSFLTAGMVKFLTFFQFDLTALPSKIAKKYGVRRYSSIMEWDYSLVIFFSTLSLLIFAILCKYLLPISLLSFIPLKEISHYSIYYLLFNMIPFGKLDGMRMYLGSRPLYITTLIIIIVTGLIVFF
jgi:hypothetical protein